jgi:hypothetical protein
MIYPDRTLGGFRFFPQTFSATKMILNIGRDWRAGEGEAAAGRCSIQSPEGAAPAPRDSF